MSVEILDMIIATPSLGVDQSLGETVDAGFVRRFVQAHEDADFDRVLVGHLNDATESAMVSSFVTAVTRRLGVLLAYRPGVIAASLAACQLATLDQFGEGRLALNAVSGGNDEDLACDGDYLDHDRRYVCTDEYLQILCATWTTTGPVNFGGEFYRSQGISPAMCPRQSPHIPIYFNDSSDAAIEVAARHADTYMFRGEPPAAVDGHIRRVRAAIETRGRDPRFSVSFRPIVADIEEAAWKCTAEVLEQVCENRARLGLPPCDHQPQSVGSQRLLTAAERGEVRDSRLWTGVVQLTGARWNPTILIGILEQAAAVLGEYYRLGVSTFLIQGFDLFGDAVCHGQGLIPAIHDHIARLPLLRCAG